LEDVWSYSELHGMLHSWRFLTGSLPQLKRVWKKYAVQAAAERGVISHSPALFVIDPQGRRSKVYITQMSYTAVGQLGQVLANEASRLLPDHPPVHSDLSYSRVAPTAPADQATLPRAGGGSVSLGAGKSPRLYLFFATWDRQTSGLAGHLQALNRYQTIATRSGLPRLTAVDEASVEPDATTLTRFLDGLARPPNYPIAVDRSGKVADGYEVLGLPWFVLVSPNGKIIYYRETSTSGWPSINELIRSVRAALARAPKTSGARSPQAQLAGSPQPLASLHAQAGQVLGSGGALQQRLRSLRGYPVVINAWASWCGPCRTEFPLLASESIRYGRKVAFLGLDTNDSLSDARTFLASHPVSYPSYQGSTSQVRELLPQGLFGLPTTIFIDRKGKVSSVHSGPYESPGTLDQDVERYALGTAG
jgi:thiol-disulfide isomerase/thioredoxin